MIWYGSWGAATTGADTYKTAGIIQYFIKNLSSNVAGLFDPSTSGAGKSWIDMNQGYGTVTTFSYTPSINYDGSLIDTSNKMNNSSNAYIPTSVFGKNLSQNAILNIVNYAISNKLSISPSGTADANGIYYVLTSGDIKVSGFMTSYCGWHSWGTVGGLTNQPYGFIGNPSSKLWSCAGQTTASPNANVWADAMVSVIAHEITETMTDPTGDAWFDNSGYENADKCAWKFGAYLTTNNAKYNSIISNTKWYIQQNWDNVAPSGLCSMKP